MSSLGDSKLKQKALQIAAKRPGEKFIYRLRCKAKYEYRRLLVCSKIKQFATTSDFAISTIPGTQRTFSESLQDLFVVKMTSGSALRHYLEIGSGPPVIKNNTYLLEAEFGWYGLSLDFNPKFVQDFHSARKNPIVQGDATKFDYLNEMKMLDFPYDIGYLQIDIDPSHQSLLALFQIPFSRFRFAVITFEHDLYRSNYRIAKISRQKLRAEGYHLVVKNVLAGKGKPFEDWWVHPDLVSSDKYRELISNRIWPSDLFNR